MWFPVVQELNYNPLETRIEIHAYAGPMNHQKATEFQKKWKTPPRIQRSQLTTWRLADSKKGLEREGRNLAQHHNVAWKEYWKFLDTFVDISSSEGLLKLEKYLSHKYLPEEYHSSPCSSNGNNMSLNEESPTCSMKASRSEPATSPVSPMTDLCISLQACSLSNKSCDFQTPKCTRKLTTNVTVEAQRTESNSTMIRDDDILLNMLAKPGLSPFLYVEKSCQVFGKRIADGLTHIALSEVDVCVEPILDFLKQEMKHLQLLVNSYMDDPRFVSVDFHLIHSRIATIVRDKVRNLSPEEYNVLIDVKPLIEQYKPNSHGSSDEEDLNTVGSVYPQAQATFDRKKNEDALNSRKHVNCITHFIFSELKCYEDTIQAEEKSDKYHYQTEESCMNVWSDARKCCCLWQKQAFLRNSRKGSSYNRFKYNAEKEKYQTRNEQAVSDTVGCTDFEGPIKLDDTELAIIEDLKMTIPLLYNEEEAVENENGSEEETFHTAPNSPEPADLESSDEEMESPDEGEAVFIEGNIPSQSDLAVLQAIEQCDITPDKYPSIYRWRHSVQLNCPMEKEKWASYLRAKPGSHCSTPEPQRHLQTPTKISATTPYVFRKYENWHKVVPPSSPASPQFNHKILQNKILLFDS